MTTGLDGFKKIFNIVQQVDIAFRDSIGNPKNVSGTGFWLKTNKGKLLFITNRHNVDGSIKLNPKYKLEKFIINYRFFNSTLDRSVKATFKIQLNNNSKIYYLDCQNSPDVAAIEISDILAQFNKSGLPPSQYTYTYEQFPESLLANQNVFDDKIEVGDSCHFLGFPGIQLDNSTDVFPISRNCNISSYPLYDYFEWKPKGVKTKDICLVSGLSFGGSSGSPILTYQKGIKLGAGMAGDSGYLQPYLIGVMSGHWEEELGEFNEKAHKGLSYFTRSTSIIELIKQHNL